jgi:hypothetical protein
MFIAGTLPKEPKSAAKPERLTAMKDDSNASFAIIRYNARTYESGGVMAVVKGREQAQAIVTQFERSQTGEDRHIGWRYFMEKTDLRAGMDPAEATNLRQSRLEMRESES